MNFRIILFSSVVLLSSCKINQTINHHREGKWVYKDTLNGILYKSKGRYSKSREIKTWKHFENRKLVKTEQYQDTLCYITTFDAKGKVTSKGKSVILEEKDGTHWYVTGDWLFYDDKGMLIGIKKYEKGELLSETLVN